MTRRYRPTFLLELVVLCASVAAFFAVFALLTLTTLPLAYVTLATLGALIVGWFAAIELQLLPWAIERWLVRRAEAAPRPDRSPWFVDLRAEERRAREDRSAEVCDNPALW
jgi:hypothetical protein